VLASKYTRPAGRRERPPDSEAHVAFSGGMLRNTIRQGAAAQAKQAGQLRIDPLRQVPRSAINFHSAILN